MSRSYYRSEQDRSFTVRGNVKLLNVSSCKYGGDWHSVLHAHTYTELFFITGGKGKFLIQDQVYPVDVNNIIIINPNVSHTEASINAQPMEYIVLGISGVELSSSVNANGQFCILDYFQSKELSTCIRNILREMELKNTGYEDVCQAYMEILIIRLMRAIAISTQPESGTDSGCRQCIIVKRYIDQHFKEPLTLDQLSEAAHMNKYYLSHAFKREYGISPINYLIFRRIEESKNLLAETDLSISQIALILGFSSSSYFSQVFHKSQGISPMEFRQNSNATTKRKIFSLNGHEKNRQI